MSEPRRLSVRWGAPGARNRLGEYPSTGPSSNAEAGRIRKAREAIKDQPPGQNAWDDHSIPLVDRIVLFCESLVITKGLLQGQRLKLLEHQRDFIAMIWGADPRPKLAISSMPRGQGKSTFLAALATAALLGPLSERRGEIVSVAVTKDQAAIIHAEIAAFITEIPQFSARCAISHHRKTIEVLDGNSRGSVYRSLAADAAPALGLAPNVLDLRRIRIESRQAVV